MSEPEMGLVKAPAPDRYSYAEACQTLNIQPHTFRQLIFEYSDILGDEGDEEQEMTAAAFDRLRRIVEARGSGASPDQIRDSFMLAELAAERNLPDTLLPEDPVLERLNDLTRQLRLAEDQRRKDRDRMITAMIRAQQEIEHLRNEIAATTSRKDKRKKGFWARLWDF